MKFLALLLVLLMGCATGHTYKGGLDYGSSVKISSIACPEGDPYYGLITAKLNFEKETLTAQFSFQCWSVNSGTHRIYLSPSTTSFKKMRAK